jgi:hypothetical protein
MTAKFLWIEQICGASLGMREIAFFTESITSSPNPHSDRPMKNFPSANDRCSEMSPSVCTTARCFQRPLNDTFLVYDGIVAQRRERIVPIKELMDSSLDFLPWITIKRLLHNLPFVCHLLLLISLEHEDIAVKGSQLAEIAEDSNVLCRTILSWQRRQMYTYSLSANDILRSRIFACCDRSFLGMKPSLLGFWKNNKSAQTMSVDANGEVIWLI